MDMYSICCYLKCYAKWSTTKIKGNIMNEPDLIVLLQAKEVQLQKLILHVIQKTRFEATATYTNSKYDDFLKRLQQDTIYRDAAGPVVNLIQEKYNGYY